MSDYPMSDYQLSLVARGSVKRANCDLVGKSDLSDLPLVSVITPCLNMGRFLRETIESVLAQDYPRIEYIVMDGGSTDATLAILADYAGRLTYFSGPDAGTADAVNRGFRKAHGSILAFLNADDTYLAGGISSAVQALLTHATQPQARTSAGPPAVRWETNRRGFPGRG